VKPTVLGTRRRLVALVLAIAVIFAVIALRLVDVQAASRSHYVQLGVDQRVRRITVAPERGSIFDRNGNDLAISVQRQTIWADPHVIAHPIEYAAQLAPIVGVAEADLRAKLSQKKLEFVYLARQADPSVVDRVKALHLAGIGFTPESKRYYPSGNLAAPLLGFVGLDNNGLGGLEVGDEKTLAGRSGTVEVERDPQGVDLPGTAHTITATRRGSDLVLTLDQSIQYEAERALTAQVAATQAKGGMAITADVRTGDILAMVSVDGAKPAIPGTPAVPATATTPEVPAKPDVPAQPAAPSGASEHNKPLTDVFEPGSTNKVVTIAAAIEAGLVKPDTVLDVPSTIHVYNTDYSDVDEHPSQLSVADILRDSSNVGTILVARQLGPTRFDAALRAFGFGKQTGLGFPGEAPGILLPLANYNATSMASMPIGNGIAVTAMQMLDVYMTLANDGVARQPRLVEATIGADGTRHDAPLGPARRVVSSATARQMRQMLARVVESGTGTKAAIPGYSAGGKTGTARKPPYLPGQYVASFVGFAPVENPRLATIVVLDTPGNGQIYGGEVSAPVFSRIMQSALAVEQVPAQ
jgi:cell division protein FtsI (penicillin-binding protein 3)